jgi:hypothetical protein
VFALERTIQAISAAVDSGPNITPGAGAKRPSCSLRLNRVAFDRR